MSFICFLILCFSPIEMPPGITTDTSHLEIIGEKALIGHFQILNGTNHPVLLKAAPSCSCITITFSNTILQPQSSATCTVAIDILRPSYGVVKQVEYLVDGHKGPKVEFVTYGIK
jgi:hypothetical protein